jgi:hypothetical protein
MMPYLVAVDFDIVLMFDYLGESRWSVPWARGQLGGWGSFLDHMQYFGYLLPCLAVYVAVRQSWFRLDVWVVIGMAIVMLLFLSTGGSRRIIGVTVGSGIICWALMRPHLNIRTLFAAFVAVSLLLGAMQFLLLIRTEGLEGYVGSLNSYRYLHVDDNIFRLMQIIQIVPAEHPYVYFKQIVYVLVRPIPRVFWEGKPIDPGFDLPSIIGQEGTSLSSSILGEWYLVWGWPVVILGGWLHGRMASAVRNVIPDERSAFINPIVYSVSTMVLVAGLRSMQDLVIMSYAVLAWYLATLLIRTKATKFRPRV